MAENEETKAAAEQKAEEKPKAQARRSRGRARPSRAPAGPRASIELGEGQSMPVGPMDTLTVDQSAALAQGVPDEIVANMEETRIRRKLGMEVNVADFLDQDAVRRAHEDEAPEQPRAARGQQPIIFSEGAANEEMIKNRPAEKVDDVTRFAAPGLTERGWSAEVTARHPEVMAATMAELASEAEGSGFDPIDPTDPVAVQDALTQQGFAEVRRDMLRAEAARVGAVRLAAATGAQASQSGLTRAAHEEAVARAEFQASNRGGTAPPSDRDLERAQD